MRPCLPAPGAPPAKQVPSPVITYSLLGLADLAFTLAALMSGAREANPVLAWFFNYGLFEFAKLSFTLLVCCLAVHLWAHVKVRKLMGAANLLMAAVAVYHGSIWAGFSWA